MPGSHPVQAPVWELSQLTAEIVAAERHALGTVARVVVWPAERVEAAAAVVETELDRLDRAASRFRPDSEISRTARPGDGVFIVGSLLAEAIEVALAAASWTDGRVVPTAGAALVACGYDRDFALVESAAGDQASLPDPVPLPDWRNIHIDGALLRMPPGTLLDLGATAKALGADRAARAARSVFGGAGGVLVSLGGDLAMAGTAPEGGWPVVVGEHRPGSEPPATDSEAVRVAAGGLATSSTVQRAWRRGGRRVHHILDPSTGLPVDGPWRTATVHAATCVEANAASTAAIVAGEEAESWLEGEGLAARLVACDGGVCYLGGWPAGGGTLAAARCSNRGW
jgi:FAD:protein FMN transferase